MNLKDLRDLSKEDILGALGLQSRRSTAELALPVVGIFAAGVLVGTGLGLLFAPKAGRELREDLGERVNQLRTRETNGQGLQSSSNASH